MIVFCDGEFTTQRDRFQWVLKEHYQTQGKDGQAKTGVRETYHATLEQVCKYILDRKAGECAEVREIRELFLHAKDLLAKAASETGGTQ